MDAEASQGAGCAGGAGGAWVLVPKVRRVRRVRRVRGVRGVPKVLLVRKVLPAVIAAFGAGGHCTNFDLLKPGCQNVSMNRDDETWQPGCCPLRAWDFRP